ncbi:MAG: FKBP-type peptidyl-prolyl cis-trans isomerase [Victivallales bacterium]|nr:FKBP-type peptidyl-prolyl cis-trans isomerase [Victivallales bacterium]MBR4219588.1 FKBP-type peptidyl-prolyl cis-trans isomerase [Victivallales bacterium]
MSYSSLKTEVEKYSYCLGLDMASRVKGLAVEVNKDAFVAAIKSIMDGEKQDISNEEYNEVLSRLFKQLEKKKQEMDRNNSASKEAGDAFRAENAKKPGVIVTASGLQYEILTEGSGKSPKPTDKVKVHYEGTLIDGTVFDSSYKRNQPITFPLNQVIKGWTEGLGYAKVGSKLRLVIPPDLGYGSHGVASIPPFSTLIFTVELLGIE